MLTNGTNANAPREKWGEWIKMSDKLPEIGADFLGFSDGTIDHYRRIGCGIYFNQNSANESSLRYVTHWMLLPEPPED